MKPLQKFILEFNFKMSQVFWGWIPCLNGRLSFSILGGFLRESPSKEIKSFTENGFLCKTQRNLRDGIFSRNQNSFLALKASKLDTKTNDLEFCFSGSSSITRDIKLDRLNGQIHIKCIEQIQKDALNSQNLIFTTDVTVFRNGRCRFENGIIGDNVIWSDASEKEVVIEYLTSQSYMFVRDVFHRHKHHTASSDTIIDIYAENNKDWESHICFDLSRYVIKYKKSGISRIIEKLGTLAYLEAFMQTIKPEVRKKLFSSDSINILKSSLEIEQRKISVDRQERL